MAHDLDGIYSVSTTSSYLGPLEKKSDGRTEIKNGQTKRYDEAHCLWTSTFTIISENEVEMISIADPTEAEETFALTNADGSPTRKPVEYKTVLKLARKGDKIQMSGQIEYGNDVIFLTMRKI